MIALIARNNQAEQFRHPRFLGHIVFLKFNWNFHYEKIHGVNKQQKFKQIIVETMVKFCYLCTICSFIPNKTGNKKKYRALFELTIIIRNNPPEQFWHHTFFLVHAIFFFFLKKVTVWIEKWKINVNKILHFYFNILYNIFKLYFSLLCFVVCVCTIEINELLIQTNFWSFNSNFHSEKTRAASSNSNSLNSHF